MAATANFLYHCGEWLVSRISYILTVMAILLAGSSYAAERPSYLGFEPAYPKTAPPAVGRSSGVEVDADSVRIMTLGISRDGRYISVQAPQGADPSDLKLITSLFTYLKKLEFEPARFNGVPVESRVPAQVRFRSGGMAPDIQFAVDWNRQVTDYDLYVLALAINDIKPPRLVRFPSLHAVVGRRDSTDIYPYTLVRLDLNERGRASRVETIRNTLPHFSHQTLSACNWADFEPARVHGHPTPATVYLLVSFFPEVSYPTLPLVNPPADTLMIQMRMGVSVRADTLGLLAKPIPRNVFTDRFTLTGVPGASFSEALVWTEVDTLGNARGLRVNSPYDATIQRFRTLVGQLRFYPALSMSGEPVMFMGPLEARFVGSGDVRIRFLWLFWDNPRLVGYLDDYQ